MRSALLLVTLGLAGCDSNLLAKSCTDIGCADALNLSLRAEDGHWPTGEYRVELDFEAEQVSCTFNVPAALPANPGAAGTITCGPSVFANFVARTVCTEMRTRDAVSQSCTPLPGEWTLELNHPGTPATIKVRVTRDDQEVASLDRSVQYEESRPNGPDCEPLCRQSQIALLVN